MRCDHRVSKQNRITTRIIIGGGRPRLQSSTGTVTVMFMLRLKDGGLWIVAMVFAACG